VECEKANVKRPLNFQARAVSAIVNRQSAMVPDISGLARRETANGKREKAVQIQSSLLFVSGNEFPKLQASLVVKRQTANVK
jgi:hypothetical protein